MWVFGTRRVWFKLWRADRASLFCSLSLWIWGEGARVGTNCMCLEKAHSMSHAHALERACWSLWPQILCGSRAHVPSPYYSCRKRQPLYPGMEKEDTSSSCLYAKLITYLLASLSPQRQGLWLCLPFLHFYTKCLSPTKGMKEICTVSMGHFRLNKKDKQNPYNRWFLSSRSATEDIWKCELKKIEFPDG